MTTFIHLLHQSTVLSLLLAGVLGLIIGSFLNVIIVRYPRMLMDTWRRECRLLLSSPQSLDSSIFTSEDTNATRNPTNAPRKDGSNSDTNSDIHENKSPPSPDNSDTLENTTHRSPDDANITTPPSSFNLATPRSHCPHCNTPLTWYQNIPLFSYIALRGRCAHCRHPISIQYPLVELVTALLSILVIYQLGISLQAGMTLLLTWGFIVQSVIDLKHRLLPDLINYLLLWLGLSLSTLSLFISPSDAIFGALLGYGMLWAVAGLFYLVAKKRGMGHGDFKLLAVIGAWVGPLALLNVIIFSTLLALIISLPLLLTKRIDRSHPIPFGPFLALGGWLTLLYSPFLTHLILQTPF